MIKKIITALVLFSASVVTVYAEGGAGNPSGKLVNPFKGGSNSLFDLLKAIIQDILIPIGAVLAVVAFIYAGFKYILARGNQTKLQEAHKTLLYVVIGSAVLLGAWTISQVIQNTIGKLM